MCDATRKNSDDALAKMERIKKALIEALQDIKKELAALSNENELVERLLEKAAELRRDTQGMTGSVTMKDNFVCSYTDIISESEVSTVRQYRRTFHSSTLFKQVAKILLEALDSALTLVKRVRVMRFTDCGEGNGDYMEEETDGMAANKRGLERAFS